MEVGSQHHARHGRFKPEKESRDKFNWSLGGPQGQSGCLVKKKNHLLCQDSNRWSSIPAHFFPHRPSTRLSTWISTGPGWKVGIRISLSHHWTHPFVQDSNGLVSSTSFKNVKESTAVHLPILFTSRSKVKYTEFTLRYFIKTGADLRPMWLVAGLSRRKSGFCPCQSMWELWWIKWHLARFFSECFGITLSGSF